MYHLPYGYSTDPVYPLDTFSNGLVIVEDDNGCTDTNFVEITQPANSLTVTIHLLRQHVM